MVTLYVVYFISGLLYILFNRMITVDNREGLGIWAWCYNKLSRGMEAQPASQCTWHVDKGLVVVYLGPNPALGCLSVFSSGICLSAVVWP